MVLLKKFQYYGSEYHFLSDCSGLSPYALAGLRPNAGHEAQLQPAAAEPKQHTKAQDTMPQDRMYHTGSQQRGT
jgi:hypothetical protein